MLNYTPKIYSKIYRATMEIISQLICTCSNSTIETLEKDVNHVESKQ